MNMLFAGTRTAYFFVEDAMKKIIRMIIVCMYIICLTGCRQEPELHDDIYIFYTSDVHCGIEDNLTFAGLKAVIDDTKAEHPNVVLVDLGDYVQGGTLGVISKGSLIIEMMNAMQYDIATFGNHEFDYGMDRLAELMDMAEFDLVASNVIYIGSKKNIFENIPEYIMKEYDGVKVAFIGVLTPETPTTSTPEYFMEDGEFVYDFYSGNDGMNLADKVQKTVDEARSAGAKYVIALTHLGAMEVIAPYDSISLIHHTNGIDAVLDGHAHMTIIGDMYPNKDGKDVLLSSVGTKMENAGELIIGKDGTITSMLISETNSQSEEILKKAEEIHGELDQILNEKVGTAEADLLITDADGIRICRSRECGIGNLVMDAYRNILGTDIAVINGGSIRDSIHAGDVTYGNILSVLAFMQESVTVEATGQQIIDCLEFGCQRTEPLYVFDGNAAGEYGAFIQVSGLKYTIDTSIPSPVVLDENKMLIGFEGERRVSDVLVEKDGEYVPIDPQGLYTVAGPDYLMLQNGDGNTAFSQSRRMITSGPVEVDIMIEYLKNIGSIPAEYAEPEGRITVK